MRVLITGGNGFIGRRLAAALLRSGTVTVDGAGRQPIERMTLFDSVGGAGYPQDERVELVTGDITDRGAVERVAAQADLVWHLAAVVSAAAEADFDLGYRVNVDGTRTLLEALRGTGRRPRVVFASSFAVYGGDMPPAVGDEFHPVPQSSYGAQKAIGELLTADYSRKGFVDGRSLRLPTIVVRPGKPNKAASSFASSIIREPLAGQEVVCPVGQDTAIYILSPRRVTDAYGQTATATYTPAVIGEPQATASPALPITGMPISTLVLVGWVLIASGAAVAAAAGRSGVDSRVTAERGRAAFRRVRPRCARAGSRRTCRRR